MATYCVLVTILAWQNILILANSRSNQAGTGGLTTCHKGQILQQRNHSCGAIHPWPPMTAYPYVHATHDCRIILCSFISRHLSCFVSLHSPPSTTSTTFVCKRTANAPGGLAPGGLAPGSLQLRRCFGPLAHRRPARARSPTGGRRSSSGARALSASMATSALVPAGGREGCGFLGGEGWLGGAPSTLGWEI